MRICKQCQETELLKRQKTFCSKRCYGLHLRNNPEKRNGFKKGTEAWNKGLKKYNSGKKHWNWKGGRRLNKSNGYIELYMPNHPNANYKGLIYEHRFIMEKKIGRFLKKEEKVHHINKNKTDNRPENLHLFENNSEHTAFHWWLKKNN